MFFHRLTLLRCILLAVFLVFAGRLAYLQVLKGPELRKHSERNHLRWVRMPAPRGRILDRAGREIARNIDGQAVWLVPGEVPRAAWPALLRRLVALGLYADRAAAEQALAEFRRYPTYLPVRLAGNLDIAAVSRLVEELPFLPGVYLRTEPIRYYPEGARAAHLIGYLREIDAGELSALRTHGYRLGDRLGKAGIERAYESVLRGTEGGEQVEVDAFGRVFPATKTVRPRPGTDVTLTLDLAVQRAAEAAFVHRRGAAVALDPRTGDVLALVSAPAYDLNLMSGRVTPAMLAWLHGRQKPELNRATCGIYPPGSVFKIVTAATALEKQAVAPGSYFYCNGVYHGIHCWQRRGHGAVNLNEAIAQSCNVAFMTMAERVGIQAMANMARRFGLGQPVGLHPRVAPLLPAADGEKTVGIIPERRGLVPDPHWAKTVRRSPWMPGETWQVGIGQSSLGVSPLQAARIIAAVANGGQLVHPRLVRAVGGVDEPVVESTPLGLQPATLRHLARGLQAVVGEGTARQLDPALRIAGKTGTAQNPGDDHAWFVGYAPANAPTIVVAVLVEHGGHGGATAAPIAEQIIRAARQEPNSPALSER